MLMNCGCVPEPVAPARERGLKCCIPASYNDAPYVAPARERGLKFRQTSAPALYQPVAPARERGLKCTGKYNREGSASRSRKGAWIEMQSRRATA